MLEKLTPEDIWAGTLAVVGGVGLVLKKLNYIHIGKIPAKCPETDCHNKVLHNENGIAELKKGQEILFQKIDDMPQRVVTLLKDTKGLL